MCFFVQKKNIWRTPPPRLSEVIRYLFYFYMYLQFCQQCRMHLHKRGPRELHHRTPQLCTNNRAEGALSIVAPENIVEIRSVLKMKNFTMAFRGQVRVTLLKLSVSDCTEVSPLDYFNTFGKRYAHENEFHRLDLVMTVASHTVGD